MKKNKIKSLNEYFSQTLSGDSFNSSNGVFKVNYKNYDDLSLAVGRDPDPSLLIKDSAFQIGDSVKGNVKGRNKKIEGVVIETIKSQDGKSYIIKIRRNKDNKIYTLITGSVEFIQDRGYSRNMSGLNVSARERNASNLKYTAGNIVWGSMENNNTAYVSTEGDGILDGPMGTGWKVKFGDSLPGGTLIFGDFIVDVNTQTIFSKRSEDLSDLKNKIKGVESHCFLFFHPEMQDKSTDIRTLMGIIFLEMKNEQEAKKFIIKHFPELTGKSYGEVRDFNLEKCKELINNFL